MTAPIAPVLQRIAAIESRFGHGRVPDATPGRTFTQVLDAVDRPPVAAPGSAPAGSGIGVGATPWSLGGRRDVATPIVSAPWAQVSSSPGSYSGPSTGVPVFTGDTEHLPPGGAVTPGTPFADRFELEGARHGVPAQLLAAVGWVESRYTVSALSPDGAIGVMQIMPETARGLGVDPHDPVQAIEGAARLLADHRERFGSWDLALAAYHSGAGAVSRAGNRPPPRAAQYVQLVHDRLDSM